MPWPALVRDVVMLGMGGAGMCWQIWTATPRFGFVVAFLGMLVAVLVVNLRWLQHNVPTAGTW